MQPLSRFGSSSNMFHTVLLIALTLTQNVFSMIDPLIQLPTGTILGREAYTVENNSYFVFEGIPYGAPPTGKLRFQAPQPPEPWDFILDTTHSDVGCHQIPANSLKESENCLLLNVYTPNRPSGEDGDSMPVMLFIYGGAFRAGANFLYSPELFIDKEVILVTINYRLGLFGFLSTQDEVIPGNAGLKDQLLAIRWTHRNIYTFGGDPEKITIFGESAGSTSVGFQLLNPNNAGLISGAILQSGSSISPWAIRRDAREIAFSTAAFLNFTGETSEELFDFLQNVEADDLNAASAATYFSIEQEGNTIVPKGLAWVPVIEAENPDAFITEKMYGLFKSGNVLKIPIIIGMNSEEMIYQNQDPDATSAIVATLDDNLDSLVPEDMRIVDTDQLSEMGRQIKEIYTGGEPFTNGAAIRYASDHSFTRSIIKHAELYSAVADTYLYQFSYDGPIGKIDVHYDGAESVGHAEDLFYLFCSFASCNDGSQQESDVLTRQRLIKLWTNFAKFQNPTPEQDDLLQNVTWPSVSTANGDFLYLDIDKDLEVKNHPKEGSYSGWNKLYESLGYDDFDTY